MDDIYRDIFSDLYAGLYSDELPESVRANLTTVMPVSREMSKSMRKVIDDKSQMIERAAAVHVRPDAKYFLLANYIGMLLVPILLAQKESADRLLDLATWDVELLIRDAASLQPTFGVREISSHGIINSICRNWRKLKLSDIRIWDGSES